MVKKKVKEDKKSSHSNSIAGFFSKIKNIYFKPTQFLKSVEGEKQFMPILRILVLSYILYSFVASIISLISGDINIAGLFVNLLFALIYAVVFVFACSGIAHLGVLIFKGKQGYLNTFKPIAYALIIGIIYSFIALIFMFIVPFEAFNTEAFEALQDLEAKQQMVSDFVAQPGVMISLIISLISFVHMFVFAIKGISKFQKITKSKAGFALIISGILFAVVFILIGLLFAAAGIGA